MAYYKRPHRTKIPFFRKNHQIRLSPIRLIDETGTNIGVIETQKALSLAGEKGLDLVEVAPNVKPPVCKIMSWSKFRYELSKKKETSSKGRAKEMKEMRFSPFTGRGDIDHKLKKVREFLAKKHPVKLTIRVKGRVQKEAVEAQLTNVLSALEGDFETEEKPRKEGRNLSILIYQKKKSTKVAAEKKHTKEKKEKGSTKN